MRTTNHLAAQIAQARRHIVETGNVLGFDYTKGAELSLPAREWRRKVREAVNAGAVKGRDDDGARYVRKGAARLFEYYPEEDWRPPGGPCGPIETARASNRDGDSVQLFHVPHRVGDEVQS